MVSREMIMRLLGIPVLGAVLLAGCASPAARPGTPAEDLVWPPAPAQPRIKYLFSLARAQDVKMTPDKWTKKVSNFLLGRSEYKGNLMARPYGVCHLDDQVYVTDASGMAVVVFDRTYENVYGVGGTLHGRLLSPVGVAVNASGTVYVSDSAQKVVKVFKAGVNEFMFDIGIGSGMVRPTGICYDAPRDRLLVADTKEGRIFIFSPEGRLLGKFGRAGAGDGEFGWPVGVTADREGRIYVVDSFKCNVQVFSPEGEFIWKFGEQGTLAGHFARPRGVALDSDGNIYVTDALFNAIQIFDQKGQLLTWFGAGGSGPGMFSMPAGVFIDERDRIYVADSLNRRVQVFQYLKEGTAEDPGGAAPPAPAEPAAAGR